MPERNPGMVKARSFCVGLWNEPRGLHFLLACSFLLKSFLLFKNDIITNDGPRYVNQAIQILNGQFWSAVETDITFFYSLMIAGLSFIVPGLETAGQVISLFASVLTVIPLYLLIRDIWTPRIAFLGCSVFIVLPCFNEYAVEVMRDPLFLLVFTSMVLFAWRLQNGGGRVYLFGTILLASIAPFLRLEGLVLIGILLFIFFLSAFFDRRSRRQVLLAAAAIVGIGLLAAGYLQTETDAGRLATIRQMSAGLQDLTLWQYPPLLKEKLRSLESILPGGGNENNFIGIVSDNIRLIYLLGIFQFLIKQATLPLFLLFIFGLVQEGRRLSRGKVYLMIIAAIFMLMALDFNLRFGFLNERYLYLPLLMVLPWMGVGLERVMSMAPRKVSVLLAPAAVLIALFLPLGQTVEGRLAPQAVSARQAGEWLKSRPELGEAVLLANERKIPFYAGRGIDFLHYEFSSMEALVQEAAKPGPKLITIQTRVRQLPDMPQLPGFDLLIKFEDDRYASLVFYKGPEDRG